MSNVGLLCVANVTRVSVIKMLKLAVVIGVECRTRTTVTVLVLVSRCQVQVNLFKLNFVCLIQFRDSEFSSVVVPCYI